MGEMNHATKRTAAYCRASSCKGCLCAVTTLWPATKMPWTRSEPVRAQCFPISSPPAFRMGHKAYVTWGWIFLLIHHFVVTICFPYAAAHGPSPNCILQIMTLSTNFNCSHVCVHLLNKRLDLHQASAPASVLNARIQLWDIEARLDSSESISLTSRRLLALYRLQPLVPLGQHCTPWPGATLQPVWGVSELCHLEIYIRNWEKAWLALRRWCISLDLSPSNPLPRP